MDLSAQLVRCLEDLELAIIPNLNKQEADVKQAKGQYDHIPLPVDKFIEQLNVVGQLIDPASSYGSFVDVGCGIGTKLLLARSSQSWPHRAAPIARNIYGIEYSEQYVEIARKLNHYPARPHTIIHNDAMNETYEDYDVIYFYQPFLNRDKQSRLEELIVGTAKSGAYILANRKQHPKLWASNKVKQVWSDIIFQKV